MKHWIISVTLFLMNLGLATSPALSDDTELDAAMRSLLGSFRETYGFPGATVAYTLRDGTTGAVAVGLADVEADIPMTPESRMLAASIGKTIWGALVLSLESEGVLDRAVQHHPRAVNPYPDPVASCSHPRPQPSCRQAPARHDPALCGCVGCRRDIHPLAGSHYERCGLRNRNPPRSLRLTGNDLLVSVAFEIVAF
jgi:hypothetical protein